MRRGSLGHACVAPGRSVLLVALSAGPATLASAAAGATSRPSGTAEDAAPKGFTIRDPRITESSGLAASRLHPGIYWTHNDSDDGPYLYAVDSAHRQDRRHRSP